MNKIKNGLVFVAIGVLLVVTGYIGEAYICDWACYLVESVGSVCIGIAAAKILFATYKSIEDEDENLFDM